MSEENVTQYAELANCRDELKAALAKVENEMTDLVSSVLEWFQSTGTERITRSGRTLYLRRELWAGRAKGVDDAQAVAALEGRGMHEFCAMKVNMQGLSAWMRERDKEGLPPVPYELQNELVANEVFKVGSRRS